MVTSAIKSATRNSMTSRKNSEGLLTTKKNKKDHGYGLKTVAAIVEKYHGTLDISYGDEEFSVLILIGDV